MVGTDEIGVAVAVDVGHGHRFEADTIEQSEMIRAGERGHGTAERTGGQPRKDIGSAAVDDGHQNRRGHRR